MIRLDATNILTRWFMWSCDNLPLTATRDYADKSRPNGVRRTGAYYVERGTTLCHLFWAVLWMPLIVVGIACFVFVVFVFIHIGTHDDFIGRNGITSPLASALAYLLPEGFALGGALVIGIMILAVSGAGKTGFFKLLWQHLKSVKNRVCPFIEFEGGE
jgi:hypothetical protein